MARLRLVRSQTEKLPRRHCSHSPQMMVKGTTTRSPGFSFLISEPTSMTSPMNSWPTMSPRIMPGMKPLNRCRSEPQIAHVVTLMMASRGFSICGSGTVSQRMSFLPCQQSAFMGAPVLELGGVQDLRPLADLQSDQALERRSVARQLRRARAVRDASAFDQHRVLRELERDVGVLLDQQDGERLVRDQPLERLRDSFDDDRRQPLQRLVEQQQRGIGH